MYSVLSVVVCWEIKTEFYFTAIHQADSADYILNSTVTRIILALQIKSDDVDNIDIWQHTKNYVFPRFLYLFVRLMIIRFISKQSNNLSS